MLTHEVIRELRIAKKLTQRELAEKMGLSQQAIALIETGKRKMEVDLFIKMLNYMDNLEPQTINSGSIMDEFEANNRIIHHTIMHQNGNNVSLANNPRMHVLHDCYEKLNKTGQDKLIEHAEMLTKIPEYRKDNE